MFGLGIHESVSKEELLTLKILIFRCEILPADCHRAKVPHRQSLLVFSQLPNESDPNLKIRSARVQKLECLDHRPVIFSHEVGRKYAGRSTLASYRVYEHTLTPLRCIVNKVKYLVRDLIVRVKKHLVLLILPIEHQISYADALPHVPHRIAGTIDDVRYFIRRYEFQILHRQKVTVLWFNGQIIEKIPNRK